MLLSTIQHLFNDYGHDRLLKNAKTVVPLKYLPHFFRSLEMPLINCKIHIELNWNNNCLMYDADTYTDGDNANGRETTFKITSTKLYVPVVTLSTKDNVSLTKQLNEGFKRSVYWNEYKSKIETKNLDNNNVTRFLLDAPFQGVYRLFVLLLTTLIMVIARLKETVIENIFSYEQTQPITICQLMAETFMIKQLTLFYLGDLMVMKHLGGGR